MRRKLSFDPIDFARAHKIGKHNVAIGPELLDERLATHADILAAPAS